MYNYVAGTHDCYGCGVCATVCSQKIIEIQLNEDGFLEPVISNTSSCVNCGLCVDVCSYNKSEPSLSAVDIKAYAAWSNDSEIRHLCSSGGVAFEVARKCIKMGYKVVGVRYNADNNIAEHYIASDENELLASIGSKYIQSYTCEAFNNINLKEKHLVIGTPCQIDSFRRLIQRYRCEDNFILMDFYCHGVPSKLLWDKYVDSKETKIGKLKSVKWRDKTFGWHDSYNMVLTGKDGQVSNRWTMNDLFYELFLGNLCLGPQCHHKCKYKYDKSAADIRMGDLWGKEYENNNEGVSAVVAFTPKGDKIIKEANCELKEYPFACVASGQIKEPIKPNALRGKLMQMLRDDETSIEECYQKMMHYQKRKRLLSRLIHPLRTIRNLLKRFK